MGAGVLVLAAEALGVVLAAEEALALAAVVTLVAVVPRDAGDVEPNQAHFQTSLGR